jgi:hypothetical protein
MTVHYSAGNEHNPMDNLGRVELSIDAGALARLEHFDRSGHREYSGTVGAAELARLRAALDRAGFPRVVKHRFLPDSRVCKLDVDGQSILVARQAPEYDPAFTILDSIVAELSE